MTSRRLNGRGRYHRESLTPRPNYAKYFLLAVPPGIGGITGAIRTKAIRSDIVNKQGELTSETANATARFKAKQMEAVTLMLKKPDLVSKIAAAQRVGQDPIKSPEILASATDVLFKNPSITMDLLSAEPAGNETIKKLKSEIDVLEKSVTPRFYETFGLTTAILYIPVIAIILWNQIRNLVRARPKPAPAQLRPADVQASLSIVGAAAVQVAPPPKSKGSPREKPQDGTTDLEALIFGVPVRVPREDTPIPTKRTSIFQSDTNNALENAGFEPDVFERALISAFKVLSKTKIWIAQRYAQTPDIKRDLKKVAGDKVGDEIFDFLKTNGLLQFHKSEDCVSLEPKPPTEIGQMIIRDIGANLVKMGKK